MVGAAVLRFGCEEKTDAKSGKSVALKPGSSGKTS
jgi:hypothetical protein